MAILLTGPGACSDGGGGAATDRIVELTELRSYQPNDSLNGIRSLAVGPRADLWVIGSAAPFIHH